ncbi:MAG: ABC transporter permease subunit [Clostridiales bacterium]|jgi:putative aldouronate transport system permease protein|nr:ABC transporter permease subunit [Clostridiales bacterium]
MAKSMVAKSAALGGIGIGGGAPSPGGALAGYLGRLGKNMRAYYQLYLLIIPVVAYYLVFHYWPMYGAQIAFKDFSPGEGIWGSPWAGLKHFRTYFGSYYFWRLIRNTLLLNVYNLLYGFPAPIILALLINEVRSRGYKRAVQTITYIPHFISLIVICGLLKDMLNANGLINYLLNAAFGREGVAYLLDPRYFRTIYVASGIWQQIGWGSIIYLAAITSIDQELYEAASIDGARRLRKLIHITIPSILPTIIIMLIMRMGQMMNVGAEKVMLLYNSATYETADVISTFVYRKGLLEMDYSYSAAVGLLNSIVNFALVASSNSISKRFSETSLW